MANALFDKGRNSFLKGELNWIGNDIKLLFTLAGYTQNLATHQFHSDLTNIGTGATSGNFAGKTDNNNGVAQADNVRIDDLPAQAGNAQLVKLIIYQDSGVSGTSRLIAFIDTAVGLPFTPDGSDVLVTWDTDANKRIFKL